MVGTLNSQSLTKREYSMEQTYLQAVFALALMYKNDLSFGYDAAMCGCRDIARDFSRPWEPIAEDFEVACSELDDPS